MAAVRPGRGRAAIRSGSPTTSPAPSRRLAELIAAALPDAALRTVAGAGHMAPLTHAAAVGAEIVDFLAHGHRRDAGAA
jgi:pimeloyl-ACP methyl ester carboxylesterase